MNVQPLTLTLSSQPVVFGMYPGGAAGAVGPSVPVAPENPVKRLGALEQLKPANAPFVLHLYASYTGSSGYSAAAQVGADISYYTANGLEVELVVCYRPADLNASLDVPGFVNFVRRTVDQLGSNRGFVSLAPSDQRGKRRWRSERLRRLLLGAKDALIQGVIAAKNERSLDHFGHLKIGFNWAYATDSSEETFWSYLGQQGARRFSARWTGSASTPTPASGDRRWRSVSGSATRFVTRPSAR